MPLRFGEPLPQPRKYVELVRRTHGWPKRHFAPDVEQLRAHLKLRIPGHVNRDSGHVNNPNRGKVMKRPRAPALHQRPITHFLPQADADRLFAVLENLRWERRTTKMCGKEVPTPRLYQWFGVTRLESWTAGFTSILASRMHPSFPGTGALS
jgi:hypothetical protein